MGLRITQDVIAEGKEAVVRHWIRSGFFFFGPLFGMFVANSRDISSHPFWHKILIVAATTIFVGPAWGFVSGHLHWKRIQKRKMAEQ